MSGSLQNLTELDRVIHEPARLNSGGIALIC